MRAAYAGDADVTIGMCAHPLRAVTPEELGALVSGSPHDAPIHPHIAEQGKQRASVKAAIRLAPAWIRPHLKRITEERAK